MDTLIKFFVNLSNVEVLIVGLIFLILLLTPVILFKFNNFCLQQTKILLNQDQIIFDLKNEKIKLIDEEIKELNTFIDFDFKLELYSVMSSVMNTSIEIKMLEKIFQNLKVFIEYSNLYLKGDKSCILRRKYLSELFKLCIKDLSKDVLTNASLEEYLLLVIIDSGNEMDSKRAKTQLESRNTSKTTEVNNVKKGFNIGIT